jgi:hypothetical protein
MGIRTPDLLHAMKPRHFRSPALMSRDQQKGQRRATPSDAEQRPQTPIRYPTRYPQTRTIEPHTACHRAGDAEPVQGGLVGVGGPFRDRDEGPGACQHRAHGQAQDHRHPVPPPRRARGSGMGSQHRGSRSARFLLRPCAAASNWPIAGSISDDGAAGMAPQR